MQRVLFSTVLFLLCSVDMLSQTEAFSKDKTKFLTELKNTFNGFDRVRGKVYSDKIDSLTKAGAFPDEAVPLAADFLNAMARKKLRVMPHYAGFMDVVFAFINQGKMRDMPLWTQSAHHVLGTKTQGSLSTFLENSALFYGSGVIYRSMSVQWQVSGGGYSLVYSEGKDPYFSFTNADLRGLSKGDSAFVLNTDGNWDPFTEVWTGRKGRVTWERTGLPASEVYAEMNNYRISLKSAEYSADSVYLYHSGYFKEPVLGGLEDKMMSSVNVENVIYPRFTSYEKRVKLDNLADGVRYEGGFTLKGNKFIGTGDIQNPAFIFIDRENKPFLSMGALGWIFRENQILSDRASATIYMQTETRLDSLYHPGCQVKYFTDRKELQLLRQGEGIQQSKFSDTYHNIDFDVEALYWKVKEDKLVLSSAKGSSRDSATFFSDNYFRQRQYDRLAGLDSPDPLAMIKSYCDKNNTTTFTVQEMAKWFKDDVSDIRILLARLSISGFINYNPDNERAEVKKRFLTFVGARYGRNDYDIIELGSAGVRPNGFISLIDYRLELDGVKRIPMSDSQRVVIYPEYQHVLMREDMDMHFNGGVVGGQFTFLGKQYDFDYEKFRIKMPVVDTILVRVRRLLPDEFGQYPPIILGTPIEQVSGELEIDHPDGKSGLRSIGRFPVFISKKPSFTYYSQPWVEGGVYTRDRFFFQIDPYELDSLDTFDPRKLRLPGTFTSAGIFPDIREELQVMPDYSLGFTGETGSSGLPAYGGPAKFFNTINLSNQGLRGQGVLEYQNSKTQGKDFRFYPDSMNAWAQGFTMPASGKTPDARGDSVYIHWEPKNGMFGVKDRGKPFSMYGGKVSLTGRLEVTSAGLLEGGGTVDIGNAVIKAKKYSFSPKKLNSDSADFALKNLNVDAIDTSGIALTTTNMKTEINFEEKKGKFIANDANAYVDFPINEYRAFSERVDWDMVNNNVELKTIKPGGEGFRMVSTRYGQDSLDFHAQSALFKTADKRIEAEGIKYIDVADSRVLLADGKANIIRRADIEPLQKARIQMPVGVQNHLIENATVDIGGKYAIAGEGEYAYKDKTGREQMIRMHTIKVDSIKQMTATGTLEPKDSLKLMPHVLYKGYFNLYAQNPEPEINGFITMDHNCPLFSKRWMRTRGFIGEGDISIPVPADAKDDTQTPMFNGFAFASDSSGIYPVLMSAKKTYADYEALTISGYLKYDLTSGEYRIASKEKLADPSLVENYVAFNPNTCMAYGEGPLQLTGKMGQVNVATAGVIRFLPQDTITEVEGVIGMDFPLDNELWKYIGDKYKEYASSGPDFKEEATMRALLSLLEPKERDRFQTRLRDGKLDKLPSPLNSSLFLTGINLSWNKRKRSLMYNGPANLLSLNRNLFDKGVQVYVEVVRKRSAEGVNMLIEFNDGTQYYFSYRLNVMQVYSSDTDFNKLLMQMDPKRRTFEAKDQPNYQFTLSSQRRMDQFKAQFE